MSAAGAAIASSTYVVLDQSFAQSDMAAVGAAPQRWYHPAAQTSCDPDMLPAAQQQQQQQQPLPGTLMLLNSLTDDKVPFVPATGIGSRSVTWYSCGPTVYDSAHMGHARNYLTFDVIRRVMEDYFGYNILYVMNVTDVDDKIILRARRNHLLDQFKADAPGRPAAEVGGGEKI